MNSEHIDFFLGLENRTEGFGTSRYLHLEKGKFILGSDDSISNCRRHPGVLKALSNGYPSPPMLDMVCNETFHLQLKK